MEHAKVLIVGSETKVRKLALHFENKAGFLPLFACNGREALQTMRTARADLIILDTALPDTDGMSLCMEIRKNTDIPILFLSGKSKREDIISGLESGADDYITKPCDPAVLAARVRAHLRRYVNRREKLAEQTFNDGRITIDFRSCDVWIGNEKVTLSAKERKLLIYLASHPNRTFHVEQLYDHIWGWDHAADDHTVKVHIFNIRRKIELNPSKPAYIQTVRGFGYKFNTKNC